MSGDGFINKGLEIIRLRGHPKFYNFVTRFLGLPELVDEQIQKFEQIGAKIGLKPPEVRLALAGSSTKNPPSAWPSWLKYLLLIIVIFVASLIGIWVIYRASYIPGTTYDALAPHDFE